MWGPPQKIHPFLVIFTLFHLKNWPYLQKPELRNLPKTRFWLPLVNKSICTIPPSWATPDINIMAGESCVLAPGTQRSCKLFIADLDSVLCHPHRRYVTYNVFVERSNTTVHYAVCCPSIMPCKYESLETVTLHTKPGMEECEGIVPTNRLAVSPLWLLSADIQ